MVNPRPKTRRVREDAPEKAEWKSRILKEIQTSQGVKWRAQISTAPDGTQFAGIRKVAVKRDGTEVMTKDGLSFKYDASTINDEVDLICDLLQALTGGKIKVAAAAREGKIVLANSKGDLLIGVLRPEGKVAHTGQGPWKSKVQPTQRLFKDVEAAKDYREKYGLSARDWKVRRV